MSGRPEVMEFLLSRRSRPAKLLKAPGPDRAALELILTAGLRVPDHGKLEPWRLIVLMDAAPARFAAAIRARGAATGQDAEKAAVVFDQAPVCVVLVGVPRTTEKVPEIEQMLSAGAAGVGIVNAALASGWGASWLTGWPAYDRGFLEAELALGPKEWVAGFIHIGAVAAPPPERPRPDMEAITTWVRA